MKLNLAKAALEGVAIRIKNGETLESEHTTIAAAHDSILHHMRMKYHTGEPNFKLYFVIDGCKIFGGGDETLDLARTRYSVACGLDPSGLLAKVNSVILDNNYVVVAEF
jgi:hypothetical protein